MPRRLSKSRALGVAIAAAALIGGAITAARLGAPRTRFELASELAATWERALEERLAAIYGAGAIEVAVLVELDDAQRSIEHDELDPSTAIPQQKANGVTTYAASRTREQREERSPRVRLCRATLCATPQLALPSGVLDRPPSESEREQLEADLAAITRASLPLCSPSEDEHPTFELVLREAGREAAPPTGATTPAVLAWPLALGLALLGGVGAETLRRRRRRRAAQREEAQQLRGLERARAAAARAPRRAARVLERWCTTEASTSGARDARSAALLLAELGGGLTAAVLSAVRPEVARRLALLLEAQPARRELAELEPLGEQLAEAIEEEQRHRELEVETFLELAQSAVGDAGCATLQSAVADAAAQRRALAILEALTPAEMAARLASLDAAEAAATVAALPVELAARTLASFDAAQRAEWLERVALVPAATPSERSARVLRLAAQSPALAHEPEDRGAVRAARIAARWPRAERDAALEQLQARAPELAPLLREHGVAFEDVALLAADELRTLLGCLELGELALALRGAPAAVESAIERALTPRVRERLREERASAMELPDGGAHAARVHLVTALRELFERGEIDLSRARRPEVSAS